MHSRAGTLLYCEFIIFQVDDLATYVALCSSYALAFRFANSQFSMQQQKFIHQCVYRKYKSYPRQIKICRSKTSFVYNQRNQAKRISLQELLGFSHLISRYFCHLSSSGVLFNFLAQPTALGLLYDLSDQMLSHGEIREMVNRANEAHACQKSTNACFHDFMIVMK